MSALDEIKHIVVLMMENRSFDHMLGFLGKPGVNGLTGQESNPDINGDQQKVTKDAKSHGLLFPDPLHDFTDVNWQIFGNAQGIKNEPTMQGFIQNYYTVMQDEQHSLNVMRCFTPQTLPVLSTLANNFAVCDNWYSSVPGPTLPNRAYAHFGTSFGGVNMAADYGLLHQSDSIYERLRSAGIPVKLYYSDMTIGFVSLLSNQPELFGTMGQFLQEDSQDEDKLPAYSFLEPLYSDQGDMLRADQHPDFDVITGEQFILQVYTALRRNESVWNSTLLVVVYDEHGGLYDHVEPPPVPPPGDVSPEGFKFNRLGVRVPAVLVSPWIDTTAVDHRTYEHASIPATVARKFGVASNYPREAGATSFLNEDIFSLSEPRTDDPIEELREQSAARSRVLSAAAVSVAPDRSAQPLDDLVINQIKALRSAEQSLPVNMRTHIDTSQIQTMAQASPYIAAVMKALRSASSGGSTYSVRPPKVD